MNGTRDRRRAALAVLLMAGLGACSPGAEPPSDPALDEFALDEPRTVRVTENITACVVDGVCSLALEFADTTVVAEYGSGERPADDCTVDVTVSDAAFEVEAGDVVVVNLRQCERSRLILRSLG